MTSYIPPRSKMAKERERAITALSLTPLFGHMHELSGYILTAACQTTLPGRNFRATAWMQRPRPIQAVSRNASMSSVSVVMWNRMADENAQVSVAAKGSQHAHVVLHCAFQWIAERYDLVVCPASLLTWHSGTS